jgi:hypothetical protein
MKHDPLKTLVVVQSIKKYEAMTFMNLPLWRHHGSQVVIMSPWDSQLVIPGSLFAFVGEDEWAGAKSIERWVKMLAWCDRECHNKGYRYVLMHESDSVCLTSKLPEYLTAPENEEIFFSNEMPENAEPRIQEFYCLAPWFFSAKVVRKLMAFIQTEFFWPVGPLHGDRWLGQLLVASGVAHRKFEPGIGCGTLGPVTAPDRLPELNQVCDAVRNGAVMIHGVKTQPVQERLLKCVPR